MSSNESRRIRKYWEQTGGLLIEKFQATPKKKTSNKKNANKQIIDAIIVLGEKKQIQEDGTYDFTDKDIIIVQTEKTAIGMQLLGEAFSAREKMMPYQPHSIKTVAICSKPDEEMFRLCQEFDIEMVVIPD